MLVWGRALPAGWGMWSLPCTQHWWHVSGVLDLVLCSPVWDIRAYWTESSKGPWKWWRYWSVWHMGEGSGRILQVCINMWGQKLDIARDFSALYLQWAQYRKFHLNTRKKFHCKGDITLNQITQRVLKSLSLEIVKTYLDMALSSLLLLNLFLAGVAGLGDLQRSSPTSTSVWFCGNGAIWSLWSNWGLVPEVGVQLSERGLGLNACL